MATQNYTFSLSSGIAASITPRSSGRIPYASCPLCDGKQLGDHRHASCAQHPMYKAGLSDEMRWMQCADCKHVFTHGYWNEEALARIFGSANPHQLPGNNPHGSRSISAKMVEKVIRCLGELQGTWLDVGFGNGALLGAAQEYGFNVVGLDLREQAVELIRLDGIEAHVMLFENYLPPEPLRVISMADVLEHVPHPIPVLQHAHRLLADDGLLFLSMPNDECYAWRMLDRTGQNPYWGELEHYHNFGRERLYQLLRTQGFEAIDYGISERYYLCMEVIARKRA